jgi:hypothetical protein
MTCPLCRTRQVRRACPALGNEICAVCCGTKRLVEIRCPPTCGYLQASRAHPAAVEQRQRQQDLARIAPTVRDLTERQQQLFFVLLGVLRTQAADLLHPVIDRDVADATAALAATYETAARGVIYEHQVESLPAQRLLGDLRGALAEIGRDGRARIVEREAPLALRAIERGARAVAAEAGAGQRDYLALVGRVLGPSSMSPGPRAEDAVATGASGLILPPD